MQESGFVHSAFSFSHESMLGRTSLRSADKSLPPGALITFLQKGLQYVGIEESLQQQNAANTATTSARSSVDNDTDFSILSPTCIAAISRRNPPIQLNIPPKTAAAAVKARLEIEAKLQAERNAAVVSSQLQANGLLTPGLSQQQVMGLEDPNASLLARQAMKTQQAVAAHMAAALHQQMGAAAAMHQQHQHQHQQQMGGVQGMPPHQQMSASGPGGPPVNVSAFAAQQQLQQRADTMALAQQQHQQQHQQPQQLISSVMDPSSDAAATLASVATQGVKRSALGPKRVTKKQKSVAQKEYEVTAAAGFSSLEQVVGKEVGSRGGGSPGGFAVGTGSCRTRN
jgi:hypothetical protein